MEQTKNWGGHRTGSGRKKNDSLGNKKYVYFEIDDETNEKLEKLYKAMKQYHSYTLTRKEIFRLMVEDNLEDYEDVLQEKNEEFQDVVKKIAMEYYNALETTLDTPCNRGLESALNPCVLFEGWGMSETKKKAITMTRVEANKISVSGFIKKYKYLIDYFNEREIKELKSILFKIRHKFDEAFDLMYQGVFNHDSWRYTFYKYAEEVSKSKLYE